MVGHDRHLHSFSNSSWRQLNEQRSTYRCTSETTTSLQMVAQHTCGNAIPLRKLSRLTVLTTSLVLPSATSSFSSALRPASPRIWQSSFCIFSYLTNNGGGDTPNGDIGNAGAQLLIPNITDTRTMISDLNLGKTIQVGNADAGSFFNNEVLEAVDYGVRTLRLPRD